MIRRKEIRLGLVGVNGRGRLYGYWHRPAAGVTVAAGADVSTRALDRFKERCNPDAWVTTDFRRLLERDDLDAVAITTPDRFHAEQAILALEADKHVYCEKPLAISIGDCDRILSAARRSRGKLMVGFNLRYADFVRRMKEVADSGEIGEIKAVWVRHFVGMGGVYYFHSWGGVRRHTASLLLQKGAHDIDVIHHITGQYTVKAAAFGGLDYFGGTAANTLDCPSCPERERCPDTIMGHLDLDRKPERRFCAFRREIDIPDNYVCLFELANGIRVSYNECHFTPDYQRNYTFIGTEGRMENNEIDGTIRIWKRRPGRNDRPDRVIDLNCEQNREAEVGHGGSDQRICDDFIEMIRSGGESPVPALAGRMAVAAGLSAQQSLDAGGVPVAVPAVCPAEPVPAE